jgi:beta-N-acetylhexosaminidase
MSCEEWDETFGYVYKRMIAAGTLTCMIGHITQPAYSMKLNPTLTYGECLPASLSKELMTELLRNRLGFNGMIVTDATQMAGMSLQLTREEAVPLSIEAGADMFLFYRDFDEDLEYMKRGLKNGKLSRQKLEDAVTRILATKAALGLHKQAAEGTFVSDDISCLHSPEHLQWAKEVADASITLAKNLQPELFPITLEKI